jgi:hypothetical protein
MNKNVQYTVSSPVHENYWFQDLSGSIFNLDYLIKIIPNNDMTYPEKINALVRLSLYIGIILALFYSNFLFLYIPIITMLITYVLYLFRIDQLDKTLATVGPNATLNQIPVNKMKNLKAKNMIGIDEESFEDILNIRRCIKPSNGNPFMNPLVFDSRLRDAACDAVKPENQKLEDS